MSLGKLSRWIGAVVADTADLVFPRDCPGCGRPFMTEPAMDAAQSSELTTILFTKPEPRQRLCTHCQWALETTPKIMFPRVGLPIPTYAAGDHHGVRRRLLIAAKERGSADAHYINGVILRTILQWLIHQGHLPDPTITPWALVPAPTSEAAAKERGGDIVVRWLQHAVGSMATDWGWGSDGDRAVICPILESRNKKRDQVGLSRDERRRNVASTISVRQPTSELVEELRRQVRAGERCVIVVDDVLTTGATLQQCVLALHGAGIAPSLGVTLAAA